MLKIRSEFFVPTKSYAEGTQQASIDILDCSLGENPYGFPEHVKAVLKDFDLNCLSHYPHSEQIYDAIIRHWQNTVSLKKSNITLSDGSISALYLINSLFSSPNAEVVGFAQSFTDMIVNVGMLSMKYKPAQLDPTRNYCATADSLIEVMSEQTAVVYLDNPNNPTGQTMPLKQIEKIAAHAQAIGACFIIDEAYGDFITREESATALLDRFDNIIVVRSFSKGFGLAGLRAGYILSSPAIAKMLSKISNPYAMSSFSRAAACAALEEPDFPTSHAREFFETKHTLGFNVGKQLALLSTDNRVPICTIRHCDITQNLQQLFLDNGVLTVSGAEFEGLGKNFVRLRIPPKKNLKRLIQAMKIINNR